MRTPAEASNQGNFVTDWPVQGPTDEGLRAADCWWAQNVLPARSSCVDCEGPIPMWARTTGVGERLSFGGVGVRGFALEAPGDPEVWSSLSNSQQTWISETLAKLNELIIKATNTRCPSWAPSIDRASFCFQAWFNGAGLGFTKPDGSPLTLRTDGVFDQDTLNALRTVAALNPKDFPTPFPGTELPGTGEKKKLSTGAMVGIATAGAAVIGGGIWFATKKPRRRR